jgi:hypothetical protein
MMIAIMSVICRFSLSMLSSNKRRCLLRTFVKTSTKSQIMFVSLLKEKINYSIYSMCCEWLSNTFHLPHSILLFLFYFIFLFKIHVLLKNCIQCLKLFQRTPFVVCTTKFRICLFIQIKLAANQITSSVQCGWVFD